MAIDPEQRSTLRYAHGNARLSSERLDSIGTRLETIEARLEQVETRITRLRLDIAELRGELRAVKWVLTAFVAPTCITLVGGTFYFIRSLA